jgi:transposase
VRVEVAVIGLDSHKNTLWAAAVTAVGKPVSVIEAPNDDGGHELILAWAARLEGEPAWAVEGSATFGRVFVRRLLRDGNAVLERPAYLTPRQRQRSRRPDKSDRDDAIAIARSALGEDKPLPPPRRDDRSALLKVLITERDGVEAQVTRVRNRIHAHLVALPAEARGRIGNLTTKGGIRSAGVRHGHRRRGRGACALHPPTRPASSSSSGNTLGSSTPRPEGRFGPW